MPTRRRLRGSAGGAARAAEALLAREWLLTNGLGGYASGTLAGVPTRRFHGLLVAALPAPFGRMMMLNHLAETLVPADGAPIALTGVEGRGGLDAARRARRVRAGERPSGLDASNATGWCSRSASS